MKGARKMINEIGKVTIYVKDQEEAKNFWLEKMGFVLRAENQMGPMMKWIEVAASEASFTTFVLYSKEMMEKQRPEKVCHPNVILSTRDIQGTYEEMKAKEIVVGEFMQMPYGAMFSFQDQDGQEYLIREDK